MPFVTYLRHARAATSSTIRDCVMTVLELLHIAPKFALDRVVVLLHVVHATSRQRAND